MEKRKRGKMTKRHFAEIMDLYPKHSDAINEFADAISEAAYSQGIVNVMMLCCISVFAGGIVAMCNTKFKEPRKAI